MSGTMCCRACCSALQCVAVCCSTPVLGKSHVRLESDVLRSVLQCVAVCCSMLQCVAVCCSTHSLGISDVCLESKFYGVCCSVL